ncbi:hypothetical protein QQ045_027358 [Rhodiola kirilowii]
MPHFYQHYSLKHHIFNSKRLLTSDGSNYGRPAAAWFKQISNNNGGGNRSSRRLSLGEYQRAVSWSKYLVSSGAEIKGREVEEEWSADM